MYISMFQGSEYYNTLKNNEDAMKSKAITHPHLPT